jgi:hypothetical protein
MRQVVIRATNVIATILLSLPLIDLIIKYVPSSVLCEGPKVTRFLPFDISSWEKDVRCILYIVFFPYVRGFPAYLHLYLYYILWPLAPR